jgi:hypothetical protein
MESKAPIAEGLLEFESSPYGTLGMVLVQRRPAENGEKSIRAKIPEAPLILLDHLLGLCEK